MQKSERTFSPGRSEIFWCPSCDVPLLSEECACGSSGRRIYLSPPADVRLCSRAGRDLLKELFLRDFGCADFLEGRIILLNKIAGIDRRDQVFLDGHHIATLWFDITSGSYRLDLEPAGAALLARGEGTGKNMVVCSEALLRGHIKGKWIKEEHIQSQPEALSEGDNVILRIGKFSGVGVVRRRQDGSMSIRIKDVTQREFRLNRRQVTIEDAIRANEPHLRRLEKTALTELKSFLARTRLPVNVSFSGGKDSLAALCLCLKVRPRADVLFVDTGLEFPETIEYVRQLSASKKLKLHVIESEGRFFQEVESFGPPAKDFRWCCKTHKLGPLASFIGARYPKGCVTVEGRRIYESFNRSRINFIERNPYVPGQTSLSPIRNWNALEVMLYIYWNRLDPNPLYDEDFERIGCWLCPASLQSEFASLKKTHPQMHEQWSSFLQRWAEKNRLDARYAKWGFWRWRRHPPKIVEIARDHNISLNVASGENEEIGLEAVRGRSPCGLEYSIEANLTVPQNHPFSAVAGALSMIGKVKYSEDLGAAIIKTDKGRCTVFASGHIMIIAQKKEAEELLEKAVKTVLRVQTCTRCGICEKRCKKGAIKVKDTITIDEKKCSRCGRCVQGCIAVDQASKMLRKAASTFKGTRE
jgi:phosphoadenosine phosphosulfate reductase